MSNFKSQIAPKGLQFNQTDFCISDKYATILTVISYPRYVDIGFLSDITNMPGVKMVIKHIPVPFSILQKMLKNTLQLKKLYLIKEKSNSFMILINLFV